MKKLFLITGLAFNICCFAMQQQIYPIAEQPHVCPNAWLIKTIKRIILENNRTNNLDMYLNQLRRDICTHKPDHRPCFRLHTRGYAKLLKYATKYKQALAIIKAHQTKCYPPKKKSK